MARPDPHPLITELAKALLPSTPGQPDGDAGKGKGNAPAGKPATPADLAAASELPELVIFAGFLGATVTQPVANKDWRLLYLDWRLMTWLLVQEDGILLAEKVKDETAPSGERDVIWVRADAPVRSGSGPQSVEARFLTGEFTRAGDFDAPPTGGTFAGSTGVFCEAKTVGCCYRRSRG